MKCTKCPDPAFLQVDDHAVLCADCWNSVEARFVAAFEDSVTSAPNPPEVKATDAPDSQPWLSEPSVASNSVTPVELKSSPGVSAASVSPPSVAAQPFEYPDMPDFLKRVRAA